jgi:hypothetical protein
MRRLLLVLFATLGAVTAGVAGQASLVGLVDLPGPLATALRGVAVPVLPEVPLAVAAPAAVSLGMSAFTMVALRHETDLPLAISGMVVPVVVLLGFGIAVVVDRFSGFSLVESAVGLGLVLFGLVFAKQMIAPEP